MRFLVDANLSPAVAVGLTAGGHDADFGTLLAVRRQTKPSFILIRSSDPLTADEVTGRLPNLPAMAADLDAGAIVTFARGHLRSRRLPVR